MVTTVDTRGGDEVVGDVASVGAVNEVMEAYFVSENICFFFYLLSFPCLLKFGFI
jgi:hypothetical protein